ncbi:MAG TPA: diacylglycerol kinase family protein [Acidimicrobiales bacterium]|nr:diacylglycerol kinase family protein [Acidimicrobiales bacterium]
MRLLLLVNAAASSVTPRVKVMVTETLAVDHDITLAETSRRGHASRLSQGATTEGYDAVIVLGGDGTVNEAANGLAGSKTALGLLPGGSTNVFARTLGFTNDPVTAAGELLEALRAPEHSVRRVGLGRANGRYFLFHAGLGFDAAVVEQVERRGSLKRFAGHPLFLYASVTTWLRHYDRQRPHFDIRLATGELIPDVYFAICVKTNPYTFLGNRPLDVAPEAGLDSALTVVAMQTLALSAVAKVIGATMTGRGGPRLADPGKVAYESNVTKISVRGRGPFPYQLDGDYLGEIEDLDLRYEPDVLSLVVPKP